MFINQNKFLKKQINSSIMKTETLEQHESIMFGYYLQMKYKAMEVKRRKNLLRKTVFVNSECHLK